MHFFTLWLTLSLLSVGLQFAVITSSTGYRTWNSRLYALA